MSRRDFVPRSKINKSKFQLHGDDIFNHLVSEARDGYNYTYPHQLQVLMNARGYFDPSRNHRRRPPYLIEAPTGSGKTGMICLLPYALKCSKVLVLSPSPEISGQIGRAYGARTPENFFLKTKILKKNQLHVILEDPKIITKTREINSMNSSNLVIVNAQKFGGQSEMTLLNRDHQRVAEIKEIFEPFSTIIVDEAHHYPAPTWRAIVSIFIGKQIIFLTATPYLDGKPIIPLKLGVNHMLIPKAEIEGVYIRRSEFRNIPGVNRILDHFTMDNCKLIRKTIERELAKHDRISPLPHGRHHKALILVTQRDDAEILEGFLQCDDDEKEFKFAKRYNSDAKTNKNFEDFKEGKFPALIVCGKLKEGYDNPDISVCVIFRGVKSNLLFAQFVGRCMRISGCRDKVVSKIYSVVHYRQEKNWEEYQNPRVAEDDPEP